MRADVEQRVRDVAASQHGVVTRNQLVRAGLSSAAIGRKVMRGQLQTRHRGVYQLGPLALPGASHMAAVLAGGPAATLSHLSAASLSGLRPRPDVPGPIHVSVPGAGRSRRPGIRFHRVALADDERTIVDGIPITAPGRTLVDIAGMLGRREIEHAVACAERERLIDHEQLAALPERYRSRPGIGLLREVTQRLAEPAFTRSEAENRCLEMLDAARIPRPHSNVPIGPYELDHFWPVEGIAIEIDGRAYHSARGRFEGDRRKDAWLRARGIEVIRLTWRQITREAMPTAVQIGQILALARARKAATPREAS